MTKFREDRPNQISGRAQTAEARYVRGLRAAADALTEITDYNGASMAALERFAKMGDEKAAAEIANRRNPAGYVR